MSDSNSSAIVGAFSRFMLSAGLSQLPSSVSPRSRRRSGTALGSARSGRRKPAFSLAEVIESLERRSMMTANVLEVAKVLWNGKAVDAVKDEYVLRMPQTNFATAKSVVDYTCQTPAVRAGWVLQELGSGFFKLSATGVTQATVTAWGSQVGVKSIDVNRISRASKTPNDPLYGDPANWAFPKISADKAWETGTGTNTTIVAVLDSGVDYNHPDLAANMWMNPNEVVGNNADDDRNGITDDIYGYNAVSNSGDPMDDFGHGTFIAGLVGAVGNNATGMAGVNWTVKMMAVKVMDAAGNVSVANEVRGINYVMAQKMAGQNVVAINCSFGRYSFNQQESDALSQLAATGITIVAAAGNDSNDNDQQPFYPANYDIPGLISVAASDKNDALADFSNFGATTVDLAAPGVGILSARLKNATDYVAYTGPDYTLSHDASMRNEAAFDGTSASAALVSGSVGLLRSLKPAASIVQVKNAILNGVDPSVGLAGRVLTGGRLNLSNSVDLILATTGAFPVPSLKSGQALSFLEGNAGYTMAEIKVQLDRPCDPGKSCSVYYTTSPGGSANANVDYVATSGYLTFSGSETEKSFYVKIIGDRLAEAREQFAVQILRSQSRGIDPNTPAVQQVNPIILDDDYDTTPVQPGPTNPGFLPKVSIDAKRDAALNKLPIYEGNVATFVVSLDRTSRLPVSVKYRTNQPSLVPVNTALQGVDYGATSGTLTFRPGERTKEFTVKILADKVANEGIDRNGDGDVRDAGEGETFHVVLSEPINAEFNGAAGDGGGANGVNTSAAVTAEIIDASVPPAAPGFQITVNYLGTVPAGIRGAVEWAAARWSQVITGDLPDVIDPQTGTVIDDILIDVQMGLLLPDPTTDGAGGTLASAMPEEFRTTGTLLPWKALAGFDPADANNPVLKQIVLHEFGHALGFVGEIFRQKNLVNTARTGLIGANALREYRSIFGLPAALNVPLDTTSGLSHWSEDIFANELMTPYVNGATSLPLSRITVGAMQDLGYTVNYARADAYTKASAVAAAALANSGSNVSSGAKLVRLAPAAAKPIRGPVPQAAALASAFGSLGATTTVGTPPKRSSGAAVVTGRGYAVCSLGATASLPPALICGILHQ